MDTLKSNSLSIQNKMLNLEWSATLPLNSAILESVPEKPGVYRLSYKSADGPLYVFYIGRSDSLLRKDFIDLVNKNTDNICIKTHLENLECYFKYSIIENAEERKNVEKTLYEQYKPKCNLEIPNGEIIDLKEE